MDSVRASVQRKALKALAKTSYNVYDEELTEVLVEKVADQTVGMETDQATDANGDGDLSEDVGMDDNRDTQCKYCGDYHEHWIACDNKACRFQWYGWDCVGLVEAPAGKWLCALCRPRPVFPNLAGGSKLAEQNVVAQGPSGVATRKVKADKPKLGWKGYVEVPAEVKEQMWQEVEAQWEIAVLAKRTRTNTESSECRPRRRLQRRIERDDQSPEPANVQQSQQTSVPEPPPEEFQWMDDDLLAEEAADALSGQALSPVQEPLEQLEDESSTDEEAEIIDESNSSRYYRESTFEGFSDPERADNIGSGLDGIGVMDEDEEGYAGDQSADEVSDAEEFWDSEMTDVIEHDIDGLRVFFEDEGADAEESQDLEMTDGIEPDFDALDVEFEDEGADDLSSEDDLADEASGTDDADEVEARASAMDVGGGAPIETMGVSAMDHTYLELSRYGPYLVRRV